MRIDVRGKTSNEKRLCADKKYCEDCGAKMDGGED